MPPPSLLKSCSKTPTQTVVEDPIIFAVPPEKIATIADLTGFQETLLEIMKEQMDARAGFSSIRTSDLAIPRGSLRDDLDGTPRAAYKTTEFGSKTVPKIGSCKGKLPRKVGFMFGQYDPKDNNSLGGFPPGSVEDVKITEYLQQYESRQIQEVRRYKGLLYFSENVPQLEKDPITDTNILNKDNLKLKHYCQEAETLNSIFNNIDAKIYKNAHLKVDWTDKKTRNYLEFEDDKHNTCRIYLDSFIPELLPEQKLTQFGSLQQLRQEITSKDLGSYHAPLFEKKSVGFMKSKIVPVMVQAGDNGEAIIRDADFQHFYVNPLIPPIGYKSFNGNGDPENFLMGLKLLKLRIESKNIRDFIANLDKLINEHSYDQRFKEYFTTAGARDPESKRIALLKRYNDVTTLDPEMPFINYADESLRFKEYTEAVSKALIHFKNNRDELKQVGQSSAHDLVFLHQLKHPMVMHGDEAGHPKTTPEKFGKITTYYQGKFIVTNNEEQYLKVLFSNPGMLENQVVRVHPYWLRTDKAHKEESGAWLDLLVIQALQQAKKMYDLKQIDPVKMIEIFENIVVLTHIPHQSSQFFDLN